MSAIQEGDARDISLGTSGEEQLRECDLALSSDDYVDNLKSTIHRKCFALAADGPEGASTDFLQAVDTIASNVDLDLSGQEIQQALEGRVPMTLAQLAAVHRFIDSRN